MNSLTGVGATRRERDLARILEKVLPGALSDIPASYYRGFVPFSRAISETSVTHRSGIPLAACGYTRCGVDKHAIGR